MPQRFLRPQIRQSKRWNRLAYFDQSLYIRLITLVDDFARYEADPELIRSEAFPYGDPDGEPVTVEAVDGGLTTLAVKNMLLLYEVEGVKYLQLTRWQERTRAEKSKYPPPCKHLTTSDNTCAPPRLTSPPSPSPSPAPAPAVKSALATSEIPSWDEFWGYCQSLHCGLTAEWYARDKFEAANADRWQKKSDWRSYARRAKGWWENDGRPMTPKASKASNNGQSDRISMENELKRVADELKNFSSNLSDYDEFSFKRLRMVELRSRRKELQQKLGVTA
jgi:hypothetical protein